MKPADRDRHLPGTATAVLAVAAGGAIANNYAMQPALPTIARDFGSPVAAITTVASAAMTGYLLGLVLLVPLADRISPRLLIPGQMVILALLLMLAASAPGPAVLTGCFVLIGVMTTVAAQSSAVVGRYARPDQRAHSMATISAGISAGLLLSRFVGGVLTQWLGWRDALLVFSGFMLLIALCALPLLPADRPAMQGRSYFAALRTLPVLLRQSAYLRRSTATGMLWFFAFNLIWVGLAIRLAAPPYNLTAQGIGLFSLAGILGLFVTRIAGKLADRFGTRAVITIGLIAAAVSSLSLTVVLGHPVWTAIALAVFDAGCFAAQVANQASIVAIDPARSGVLNAAYLTLYYTAGAVGSAIAGMVAIEAGWTAITLASTAAVTMAIITACAGGFCGETMGGDIRQ